MKGLEILYNSDVDFKEVAKDYARDYVGSDSYDFAEKWLLHDHAEYLPMRSSTDEERAEYERMKEKHSIDVGVNIFELPDRITQNDEAHESNVSENSSDAFIDSREKLEADMRQMLHSAYMLAWMHGNENRRGSSFEKLHVEFYNLLDRQAAITEREHPGLTISGDGKLINWRGENYVRQISSASNDDTRGKLEADMVDSIYSGTFGCEQLGQMVTGWLDRQAAITAEESADAWEDYSNSVQREIAELQAQADEKWNMYVAEHERAEKLQAELDKWNEITKNIKLPDYPPFTQFVPRDDSREEIEREIDEWLGSWVAFSVPISVVKDAVIGWLDRQAAITTRRCSETYELGCEACRAAQKRKTDELEEERDYFRNQMLRCVACACRPGGFAAGVMQYPRPDGYTEPSLLVNDEIENLRTFYVESKEDSERWREGYGSILDEVHKIEGIISELGEK